MSQHLATRSNWKLHKVGRQQKTHFLSSFSSWGQSYVSQSWYYSVTVDFLNANVLVIVFLAHICFFVFSDFGGLSKRARMKCGLGRGGGARSVERFRERSAVQHRELWRAAERERELQGTARCAHFSEIGHSDHPFVWQMLRISKLFLDFLQKCSILLFFQKSWE